MSSDWRTDGRVRRSPERRMATRGVGAAGVGDDIARSRGPQKRRLHHLFLAARCPQHARFANHAHLSLRFLSQSCGRRRRDAEQQYTEDPLALPPLLSDRRCRLQGASAATSQAGAQAHGALHNIRTGGARRAAVTSSAAGGAITTGPYVRPLGAPVGFACSGVLHRFGAKCFVEGASAPWI